MSERPFYGWVVLAAAFVIITMSIGNLFTLGVFLKPIEDSMGWSRLGIGAISFSNWTVMGGGGLLAGYVSDRLGTRPVVLAGAGLLGLGLVLSSYVQEVWQLYVTFGLLVGAGVSTFSCIGMGRSALHDLLGTYQGLFLASFAIAVMAVVLGVTLRPPALVVAPRPSPALGG